ncbi:MAG: hypothetical protein R3C61_14890 [Bacteroidia bacterium]
MNSHGFEIKINGKRLCRAGFDTGKYVLACALELKRETTNPSDRMEINVMGTESNSTKQIIWLLQHALLKGDEITIEVVSGHFDPPLQQYNFPNVPDIDFKNDSIKDILDWGRTFFDD